MSRLSAMSQSRFFSAVLVCLFFPSVGWTTGNGIVAGLRERVAVLDQARVKAVAELKVKEQRVGGVTSRDQQHYKTVLTFLEQQIADSCTQLLEKGGVAAVIELPCPKSAVALEKDEEQKPVEEGGDQTSEKQQEEVIPEIKKQSPPASSQENSPPPAPETVKKEKVGEKEVREQSPETGIVASIRRWLESLFKPKPPPAKSSSETESSSKQKESSAAEKETTEQSSESTTQQVEQGAVSNDKDSVTRTGTGSREQPEKSTGKGKPSSEEQGGEQKQAQQELKPGDKQTAADGEKAGDEQALENGTEQTAGQKKSSSGNSIERAAKDQSRQEGEQGQRGKSITAESRVAEKAINQAADGSGKHESRQRRSSSETGATKTADTGKGAAKQGTDQKDVTGQQMDSGSSPGVDAELSRLEASLNEALGVFDGQLLSEQERLAARIPRQREGGQAGSGGYGAQGLPDPAGGYGSPEGEKGDGRAGSGGYEQPGSVAAGGGKPAPIVGSSTIDSDDDIVARQLREAAEKEKDPALQEKLWQEYRKYKQGSG
ncbi:MAG: hypothetical protein U9R57_09840 [Thermodesulfobacteriota bacterium]|nr:hypothetical protein [Thermodesulfobacteriota bacterium]